MRIAHQKRLDRSEDSSTGEELAESEVRFRLMADAAPVLLWMSGADKLCIYFNRPWLEFVGRTLEQERGNGWVDGVHPDDRDRCLAVYCQAFDARSEFTLDYRLRRADGEYRWVLDHGVPRFAPGGGFLGYIGSCVDITERKEGEERMIHHALHDPLTGLANRTLFLDRLDMAMKRTLRHVDHRFAILFIDLDRFKLVNDSLGHMLGDELLKEIAVRLKRCLRPTDTVSRFGGDEFVLLLDELVEAAEEQAVQVATRIQGELGAAFEIGGQEVFSSASIGIALSSSSYEEPEEMLRDADTAMYRAKLQGRACHAVFLPDMHRKALSQLKIESALRRALEREELRLHYQPIVELTRGGLVGFEALLRWQHPELGLLLPDAFLGAAEDTGIIPALGRWVLEEACRQTAAWHRTCPEAAELSINVNLHPFQFVPRTLALLIEEVLAASGLGSDHLNVEITEQTLLREMKAAIKTLHELRALGLGVCLDDFGTGYSSLSYLLRFPITTIKIDRSLVSSMRRHSEVAIVKSVTTLAHSLNLDLVAEGLETAFQLAALKRLGCELAQGFFFSTALEAETAGSLITTGRLEWQRHFSRRKALR